MNYLTFEGLPAELKNQAAYQDIAANQILVQQGETANSMNFLLSGQIRLATFTEERIINHYFVFAGESFGEIALFSDTYTCSAIADLPSRIAAIDKELFKQALAENLDLANNYMSQLTYPYNTVKLIL